MKVFLMSNWHGGKGSRQRNTDQKKFSAGYDAIFNRKQNEHGSSTDNERPDRGANNKDRATVEG